jgi:hypothetical protein
MSKTFAQSMVSRDKSKPYFARFSGFCRPDNNPFGKRSFDGHRRQWLQAVKGLNPSDPVKGILNMNGFARIDVFILNLPGAQGDGKENMVDRNGYQYLARASLKVQPGDNAPQTNLAGRRGGTRISNGKAVNDGCRFRVGRFGG